MGIKAIDFKPLAPSAGLAIGAGAMSGVNQGLAQYSRMKMQGLQMANQRQANANKAKYQQQMVDLQKQKTAGASLQDLQLLHMQSDLESARGNDDAAKRIFTANKDLIQAKTQSVLDNASPDQKAALQAHMQSQIDQFKVPTEVAAATPVNMNTMKYDQNLQNNSTKQGVAGTNAGARVEAAHIYGDSRSDVADSQARARLGAANIAGQYKSKDDAAQDYSKQMDSIANSIAHMPDPNSPAAKMLTDRFTQIQQTHDQILQSDPKQWGNQGTRQPSPASSPQTAPNSAPNATGTTQTGGSATAQPKVFQYGQHDGAQTGDVITGPGGVFKITGFDANKEPTVIPTTLPSQSSQPAPTQQAAPTPPSGGLQMAAPGTALGGSSGGL